MTRMEFKRETLIRNIEYVLSNAQQEDLPVTIKEVYAFGGILRDKERVHDFDAVFLYEQTHEQEQRWDRFRRNFNNAVDEDREISRQQLHNLFQQYYTQEMPLSKAVMIDSVSKILKDYGIEPKWAACFSWTDFYFSPLGIFFPELDKVLRKLLLKGIRGIQAIFRRYKDFKEGRKMLVAENFILAWSPENPGVQKNLETRQEEKIVFIKSELELFQKQLISLREELLKLQTELVSATLSTELSFDFRKLNSKHIDIEINAGDEYGKLLVKCEQARKEIRGYRDEISILGTLLGNIEDFRKRTSDSLYPTSFDYTITELVTYWTILRTPKCEVKEERVREVLSDLGLPENHVVTTRGYGLGTRYELEPDEDKRRELLKSAEQEKIRDTYLRPLNRIAKKFDKNFRIHVELKEGKPTSLNIQYYRWFRDENEQAMETISSRLKIGGFEVSKNKWSIRASMVIKIDGNKTIKELEDIVRNVLTKY